MGADERQRCCGERVCESEGVSVLFCWVCQICICGGVEALLLHLGACIRAGRVVV